MGITLAHLDGLRAHGVLRPGARVLDIGSSNLYSAGTAELRQFLAHYDVQPDDRLVERLAEGSTYDQSGGTNGTFVGELLEHVGLSYTSLDLTNGYRTRRFDLDRECIPPELAGTFDVVLNFGATEHFINQLNAFRAIHDAVRVGGHIVHELPAVGFIDHGYFCYTPRFLFDLAGYNAYEVVDFQYHGPSEGKDIFGIVRDYQAYFPALARCVAGQSGMTQSSPPDIANYIILRKANADPFRLPLDKRASVSVPEPLAFLHIFKTGGTAASDWIATRVPPASTFVPADPDDFLKTASSKDIDSFDLIRGHFSMFHAAPLLKRPRVIFTIVRNPEAQIMSALWHALSDARGGIDVERRMHRPYSKGALFEIAMVALRYRLQNGMQAPFLIKDFNLLQARRRRETISSMLDGLASCHVVGLTERLADSLRLLAWRMQWPAPRNIGIARESGAGRHPMPLLIKGILRRHLQLDRILYAKARERFDADFAALVAVAGSAQAIDDYLDTVATQNPTAQSS
jgi:SAM-dependent methyltransferase